MHNIGNKPLSPQRWSVMNRLHAAMEAFVAVPITDDKLPPWEFPMTAELVENYPTSHQMKAAAAELSATAPGNADRVRLMGWIAKQMDNGYLWADGVPS
jgi:hypothetical protein